MRNVFSFDEGEISKRQSFVPKITSGVRRWRSINNKRDDQNDLWRIKNGKVKCTKQGGSLHPRKKKRQRRRTSAQRVLLSQESECEERKTCDRSKRSTPQTNKNDQKKRRKKQETPIAKRMRWLTLWAARGCAGCVWSLWIREWRSGRNFLALTNSLTVVIRGIPTPSLSDVASILTSLTLSFMTAL